ncbi:MAG: S-methyl-5-thioribose-1-phosphate isomerase [Candidatus Methanomethylicia archaeon]|nr:S-methyl-5-thioribose-1-phosphate isomerase [Candidatus Methanomethylicia archaeon]MCX8169308.1 S-methyl-5-thioribose-1-phosphate isomerase [Candidatus Methanomethylicia archaeon]MDW7988909.1 S-methyl-5-thioribose-1-phosphate isomerase [Nitrososphaerota archaeon]
MSRIPKTIDWVNGIIKIVDQTFLPRKLKIIECRTAEEVIDAIIKMKIRGAPAIGVAAAMAIALTANQFKHEDKDKFLSKIYETAIKVKSSRPTARNLSWAVERILGVINSAKDTSTIANDLLNEALKIADEDINANIKIGEHGEKLIENGDSILTYCNAGSFATVYYGTALSVLRFAWKNGKKIKVFIAETRPQLQGSRITAFELKREGIPVILITDNAIGFLMKRGEINKVVVGADRILTDGTVYNKIGTYTVAILSKVHEIPFYVSAPSSTFDFTSKIDDVIIEERDPEEVTKIMLKYRIAPKGIKALNYAFDITPPDYVTAIITEKGLIHPPFTENIPKILLEKQK